MFFPSRIGDSSTRASSPLTFGRQQTAHAQSIDHALFGYGATFRQPQSALNVRVNGCFLISVQYNPAISALDAARIEVSPLFRGAEPP